MSPSSLAMVLGAVNIVLTLALIGVGVVGILKTHGRTRGLVAGGIGVLLLGRVLGVLLPALLSGASGMVGVVVTQTLIGLLNLAGIALLVVAAVLALQPVMRGRFSAPQYADGPHLPQAPFEPGPPGGPAGPGSGNGPTGGWR